MYEINSDSNEGEEVLKIPLTVEGNWHEVATSSLEVVTNRYERHFKFDYTEEKYSFVGSMQSKELGVFTVNKSDIHTPKGR